jgi:hypothetical protein
VSKELIKVASGRIGSFLAEKLGFGDDPIPKMGGAVSYASSSSSSSSHDDKRGAETEDWINLPCPTKYEDITREAISKLLQLQNLHTYPSLLQCLFSAYLKFHTVVVGQKMRH